MRGAEKVGSVQMEQLPEQVKQMQQKVQKQIEKNSEKAVYLNTNTLEPNNAESGRQAGLSVYGNIAQQIRNSK